MIRSKKGQNNKKFQEENCELIEEEGEENISETPISEKLTSLNSKTPLLSPKFFSLRETEIRESSITKKQKYQLNLYEFKKTKNTLKDTKELAERNIIANKESKYKGFNKIMKKCSKRLGIGPKIQYIENNYSKSLESVLIFSGGEEDDSSDQEEGEEDDSCQERQEEEENAFNEDIEHKKRTPLKSWKSYSSPKENKADLTPYKIPKGRTENLLKPPSEFSTKIKKDSHPNQAIPSIDLEISARFSQRNVEFTSPVQIEGPISENPLRVSFKEVVTVYKFYAPDISNKRKVKSKDKKKDGKKKKGKMRRKVTGWFLKKN